MILTLMEAAEALDYGSPDEMPGKVSSILIPAVDMHIKDATGKDWGSDIIIDPTAKMVASVLLVRWFEDPGMIGKVNDPSLISLIAQLQAKALPEVAK